MDVLFIFAGIALAYLAYAAKKEILTMFRHLLNRLRRERRSDRFTTRPHETEPHRHRIIRLEDGQCIGVLDGLRRSTDLLPVLEQCAGELPEWQLRIARIHASIQARKEAQRFVGMVDRDAA